METLLSVCDLRVYFPIHSGFLKKVRGYVRAVDGVSFEIKKGTTTGLLGESGSGKTSIGRALIRLNAITSGSVLYRGKCLNHLSEKAFFSYRKKMQMIFQDPFNALNLRMNIYNTIAEPLDIHFPNKSRKEKDKRIAELLESVGIDSRSASRYPHEFSGGQRQRICIARALAVEPEFIICDEPVSALDVSVQAQIINLLKDLQKQFQLTYLFIAHDLAVVQHVSDEVLVMQGGRIVEQADSESIYQYPQHPYTRKLLEAVPHF